MSIDLHVQSTPKPAPSGVNVTAATPLRIVRKLNLAVTGWAPQLFEAPARHHRGREDLARSRLRPARYRGGWKYYFVRCGFHGASALADREPLESSRSRLHCPSNIETARTC